MRKKILYVLISVTMLVLWSSCGMKHRPVDVFYLVSTDVLSAQDSAGGNLWRATLCESDCAAMDAEIAYVKENIFDGDFNVVAPHYHQFTFEAIYDLPEESFKAVYDSVAVEVCGLFDEFMAGRDNSRPFILAGFSQGAMLTLDLLRHMTDEQYEKMAVCYTIGYRLSEKDIAHPHIRPAVNAEDRGVVVSFNSTQSAEAVWPLVNKDACTCINPVNWRTDTTGAEFEFHGMHQRVHVDPSVNVLIVQSDSSRYYQEWMDRAGVFARAGVSHDNLHHWDLLFYTRQIHENALKRLSGATRDGTLGAKNFKPEPKEKERG